MARFKGGYFTLERRLLSDMEGDPTGFLVWSWLIGNAYPKKAPGRVFGERRLIERGQVATSAGDIAAHWGLDERAVRRCLQRFEAADMIKQEARSGHGGGRLITLVNYDKYQQGTLDWIYKNRDAAGLDDAAGNGKDESINSNGAADAGGCRFGAGLLPVWAPFDAGLESGLDAGLEENPSNGKDESINSNGAADAGRDAGLRDRHLSGWAPFADRELPVKGTRVTRETSNKVTRGIFTGEHSGPPDAPPPKASRLTPSEAKAERKVAKSTPTLEAYTMAMFALHRFEPVANATLRSLACKLVDLLGADDAPAVAEYYVLNDKTPWVVQNRHPFAELVKNSQKYYGNWKTGTKLSTGQARTVERDDANRDAINRALARKLGAQPGGNP